MTTIKDQLAFLNKIRGMGTRELRLLYRRIFIKSKYYVRPTMDIPRDWVEQRLFYAYCVKHPTYDEGSPERIAFERRAKEVMLEPPPLDIPQDQLYREELKKRVLFTKNSIKKMSTKEIDAYLAVLGLTVDAAPKIKRYVLWEYYNKKSSDLVKLRSNKNSRKLARKPKSELDNRFVLLDLILHWPYMGWPEFCEVWGELMPTVTRRSFYNARMKARRAYGDVIPRLMPGRRAPRISSVRYDSHKRVCAKMPDMNELDLAVEEFHEH